MCSLRILQLLQIHYISEDDYSIRVFGQGCIEPVFRHPCASFVKKKKWQKEGLVIPLEIIHYLEVDFLECSLGSPGLVFGITSCKLKVSRRYHSLII